MSLLPAPDDWMQPPQPVELEEDKRKKIRSPADLVSLVSDPDEVEKINDFNARAAVVGHHDTKPDDYAKSVKVAKDVKVHPDIVDVNREAWERQQADLVNGALIVGNKELRDWINNDPANVQTSRDDLITLDRATRLQKDGWLFNKDTNPYLSTAITYTGIPFVINELDAASEDVKAAYAAHNYGILSYEYQWGSPERRASILPQLLAYEAAAKERKASGAAWLTATFAEFIGGMAAATPEAAKYGVAGALTGGAIGAIGGGPAAPVTAPLGAIGAGGAGLIAGFSVQSGIATSGSIYRELDLMRDQYGQEIPEDVKQVLAFTGGLIVGVFEAAGGRLVKSAVADFMKKAATSALIRESIAHSMLTLGRYGYKGAVINSSQTLFEEMSKQFAMTAGGDFKTVFNDPQERGKVFDKWLESGAKGFVLGGAISAPGVIVGGKPTPKPDQLQVLANQNRLDKTLEISAESKQRERNPEAFADLMGRVQDESIAIPLEIVVANKEAFRYIPDLEQQLNRAATNGTDINTTIGEFVSSKAMIDLYPAIRDYVAQGDGKKNPAEVNDQLLAQQQLAEQAAKAAEGAQVAPPGIGATIASVLPPEVTAAVAQAAQTAPETVTVPPLQLDLPGIGPVTTPQADVQTGQIRRLFTSQEQPPPIEVAIAAQNELRLRAGLKKLPPPPPTPETQLEFSLFPPEPHAYPLTPERIVLGEVSPDATLIPKKRTDAEEVVRRRALPKGEVDAIFLREFRAQTRINKTLDERILETAIQRNPRTMEEFHKFIDEEAKKFALAQRTEAVAQVTAEAAARQPSTTGLAEGLGGAGKAIGEGLQARLWEQAQKGEVVETTGGKPTAVLQGAKIAREHGGLQDEASFRAYVQEQAQIPQGEGFNAAMRALVKKYVDLGKTAVKIAEAPGNNIHFSSPEGNLYVVERPDSFQASTIAVAEGKQRQGAGSRLYDAAIAYAHERGKPFRSSASLTEESSAVWESLGRRYQVEQHPEARKVEGVWEKETPEGWIFEIKPPEKAAPVPPKVTENLDNIHAVADAAHSAWVTKFTSEEGASVVDSLADPDAKATASKTGLAIDNARRIMWLSPLFESPKAIGMTVRNFANYSKHIQEVQRKLTQAVWDAAHAVIKKKETKRWKELGAEISKEVQDQVARRPEIAIADLLTTGKVRFATEGPLPPMKLRAQDVDNLFAREELAEMGIKEGENISDVLPGKMFIKDPKRQILADDLATVFQQGSGRYVIRMLVESETASAKAGETRTKRYTRLVRESINERLTKEHGDLNETILRESIAAVTDVAQLHVLTDEVNALSGGKRIDNDTIRRAIVEDMGRMTLEEAGKVERYQGQVGKWGQKAEDALNSGDYVGAFKAKQYQHMAYIRFQTAVGIKELQAETNQIIRKYADRPIHPGTDAGYNARILQFLQMVGVKVGRARDDINIQADVKGLTGPADLNQWIAAQATRGEIITQPTFLIDMAANRRTVNEYSELTVNEFRQFRNVLAELDTIGTEKKYVETAGNRILQEVFIDNMVENLSDRLRPGGPERFRTDVQQGLVRGYFRSLDAGLIKIETLLTWLDKNDPDGPMTQYFFRNFKDAQAKSEALELKYNKMIKDAMPHNRDLNGATENTLLRDEYGNVMPIRRREMFNIAGLFWSNEVTRKKLLDGYGWNEADVEMFLWNNLKKDDYDHIDSHYRIFDDMNSQKTEIYRKLRGYGMEPPEPITYVDRWGKTRTGGYWPVSDSDTNQYRPVSADIVDRRQHNPLPSETILVEQMKGIMRPSLNFEWVGYLMKQEVHDISFRPAVVNATRLLEDGRVLQLVKDAYGQEYSDLITNWVKDMANDRGWRDEVAAAIWLKASRYIGATAITYLVGFSPATAVIHSTSAAANTVAELQAKSIKASYQVLGSKLQSMADFMFRNPRNLEGATEFAWDNSPELRTRWNKDKYDLNRALGNWSKFKEAQWHYQRWAQTFVSYTDYMTAVVAWHGMYHTARAEQGRTHKDSVFLADRLVRAAHGGVAQLDKSAIQRSTALSTFTMFYGYFNHNYNQARRFGKHVQEGTAASKQEFMDGEYSKIYDRMSGSFWAGMMYTAGYVIVPALIHAAVRDKDSEEEFDTGAFLAKAFLSQVAGTIPLGRDLAYSFLHPEYPSGTPISQVFGSGAAARRGIDKMWNGEVPKPSELFHLPLIAAKFDSKYLERMLDYMANSEQDAPRNVREWKNMMLYGQPNMPGVKRKKEKKQRGHQQYWTK